MGSRLRVPAKGVPPGEGEGLLEVTGAAGPGGAARDAPGEGLLEPGGDPAFQEARALHRKVEDAAEVSGGTGSGEVDLARPPDLDLGRNKVPLADGSNVGAQGGTPPPGREDDLLRAGDAEPLAEAD